MCLAISSKVIEMTQQLRRFYAKIEEKDGNYLDEARYEQALYSFTIRMLGFVIQVRIYTF
jgi:hypothetical protein